MRFRRSRYDPYPDVLAAYRRVHDELIGSAKAGEIEPGAVAGASDGIQRVFESFTMYATMGRDRKKLGPEFAERCEAQMRGHVAMVRALLGD